jgi:hypothetical protein
LTKVTLLSKDWLSTKVFLDFRRKSENAGYARLFIPVGLKNKHTHPTVALVSYFPKNFPKFPVSDLRQKSYKSFSSEASLLTKE